MKPHSFCNNLACLLVVILTLVAGRVIADMPEVPRGKGEQCVEPAEIMRKQHMEFLLHQRDLTMREGIRTQKYSLTGCVECHVQSNSQGEFIPVNATQQFCEVCHGFASVKIDCFECHATTPDRPQSVNAFIQKALGQLIARELSRPIQPGL
jgi:hypothetical protein